MSFARITVSRHDLGDLIDAIEKRMDSLTQIGTPAAMKHVAHMARLRKRLMDAKSAVDLKLASKKVQCL